MSAATVTCPCGTVRTAPITTSCDHCNPSETSTMTNEPSLYRVEYRADGRAEYLDYRAEYLDYRAENIADAMSRALTTFEREAASGSTVRRVITGVALSPRN